MLLQARCKLTAAPSLLWSFASTGAMPQSTDVKSGQHDISRSAPAQQYSILCCSCGSAQCGLKQAYSNLPSVARFPRSRLYQGCALGTKSHVSEVRPWPWHDLANKASLTIAVVCILFAVVSIKTSGQFLGLIELTSEDYPVTSDVR